MLGAVDVLDAHETGKVRFFLVVGDGVVDQLADCRFRLQVLQMQAGFDRPYVAIGFFKDSDIYRDSVRCRKNRLPDGGGRILLGTMIRGGFLTAEERQDLTEL